MSPRVAFRRTRIRHRGQDAHLARLLHPIADIWVVREGRTSVDYAYGGTRLIPPDWHDDAAVEVLFRLMWHESYAKNELINRAIGAGILADLDDRLPAGFAAATVGGRAV